MSNRPRPVARITARDTKTGKYTDIGTVWPNRFDEEDGTLQPKRAISFGQSGNNNPDFDVSLEQVIELVTRAYNKDGVFIDLQRPFEKKKSRNHGGEEF